MRAKIFFFLLTAAIVIAGSGAGAAAARTNKSVQLISRGSAVIAGSQPAARQEAIDDALDQALRRDVYDRLLVGHEQDDLLEERIFNRKDRYILAYEILSSRQLGDLFQVELRVKINQQLLQGELGSLVKGAKEPVQKIVLVVLAATGERKNPADGAALQLPAPLLEPRRLAAEMEGEMTAYGYDFSLVPTVSPALENLCRRAGVPEDEVGENEGEGAVRAADFRSLLPHDDLAVIVRPGFLAEKQVMTVRKTMLVVHYDLLFVDLKNNRIVMTGGDIQTLGADFPAAYASLQRQLRDHLHEQIMSRLLAEYTVIPPHETTATLWLTGFRRAADLEVFRQRLAALRTVNDVKVAALAAGTVVLRVKTIASYDLLLKWLNRFMPENGNYHLQAMLDEADPGRILVQVEYAADGVQ